jgi:hypothetical protein
LKSQIKEFQNQLVGNACISLKHVSIEIFNGIFSDATSNSLILSVHLRVSCIALMVCHTRFF